MLGKYSMFYGFIVQVIICIVGFILLFEDIIEYYVFLLLLIIGTLITFYWNERTTRIMMTKLIKKFLNDMKIEKEDLEKELKE